MPEDPPSGTEYRVMLMYSDNRAQLGPVAGPPIVADTDDVAIARLTETVRWHWHKAGYALDDFIQMKNLCGKVIFESLVREIIR